MLSCNLAMIPSNTIFKADKFTSRRNKNIVAENVRIADIRIRLIDYHKADMRKNCIFPHPCECSPKLHCEVAIHLAMPLQPANQATFGGRCSQPATSRTHSDPGSAPVRKNRPSDSWRRLHPTSNA